MECGRGGEGRTRALPPWGRATLPPTWRAGQSHRTLHGTGIVTDECPCYSLIYALPQAYTPGATLSRLVITLCRVRRPRHTAAPHTANGDFPRKRSLQQRPTQRRDWRTRADVSLASSAQELTAMASPCFWASTRNRDRVGGVRTAPNRVRACAGESSHTSRVRQNRLAGRQSETAARAMLRHTHSLPPALTPQPQRFLPRERHAPMACKATPQQQQRGVASSASAVGHRPSATDSPVTPQKHAPGDGRGVAGWSAGTGG